MIMKDLWLEYQLWVDKEFGEINNNMYNLNLKENEINK